jgi:hypothetical protein
MNGQAGMHGRAVGKSASRIASIYLQFCGFHACRTQGLVITGRRAARRAAMHHGCGSARAFRPELVKTISANVCPRLYNPPTFRLTLCHGRFPAGEPAATQLSVSQT